MFLNLECFHAIKSLKPGIQFWHKTAFQDRIVISACFKSI